MNEQISLNLSWMFRVFSLIYGPAYLTGVAFVFSQKNGQPIWLNAIGVFLGSVATIVLFILLSSRLYKSSSDKKTRFRISTVFLLMTLFAIVLAAGSQVAELSESSREVLPFMMGPYNVFDVVVFVFVTCVILMRMADAFVALALEVFKGYLRLRRNWSGYENQKADV